MFRNKAIFLLVISAIIIPLLFLVEDVIALALWAIVFIACQALMLYLFYKEEELGAEHWLAFWAALLSLGFMLFLVLIGRNYIAELIGLLLFVIYFIELLVLLFKGTFRRKAKPTKRKSEDKPVTETYSVDEPTEKDLEYFRGRDDFKEWAEFFEPDLKPKSRIVELEEPRIEKIVYDVYDAEEEPRTEPRKKDSVITNFMAEEQEANEEENNGWVGFPRSMVYSDEKDVEIPEIRELKEAPKVSFDKVKRDLEKIDSGVKNISEKIRLISEKAILEGAERKLRELEEKIKPKKAEPKPKKKELTVYSSKDGKKYHYKRSCLSLKRVRGKNLLTFVNSEAARKKGLKACGMCK